MYLSCIVTNNMISVCYILYNGFIVEWMKIILPLN